MARNPERNRELRTIAQVAQERPAFSERFLRRLVYERRIPHHKVGRKVFLDLADIDRLIEQGRREVA